MKTNPPFLLFLFGAAVSLVALPMEQEFAPSENNSLNSPTRAGAGVDVRAGDARAGAREDNENANEQTRTATLSVSENEQPTAASEIDKPSQQSAASDFVDVSEEALNLKIADAQSDLITCAQQEEKIKNGLTTAEEENLAEELKEAVAYWRQESERYSALVENSRENLKQKIIEAVEICNQVAEKIASLNEELSGTALGELPSSRLGSEKFLTSRESITIKSTLLPAPPTKEEEQISNALRAAVLRQPEEVTHFYDAADRSWIQSQQVWEARSQTYRESKSAKEQLHQAENKLEIANVAFSSEELNKSILGRLARYSSAGANVAAAVPEPHFQGASVALAGLSAAVNKVNTIWGEANITKAKAEKKLAERNFNAATTAFEKAKEEAVKTHLQADAQEEGAKIQEIRTAVAAANAIKISDDSSDIIAWHQWAASLGTASKLDTTAITSVANHGSRHPEWAREQAAIAWSKRMKQSETALEQWQHENALEIQRIKTLDEKRADAEVKAKAARAAADGAQVELTKKLQEQKTLETRFQEVNTALDQLEHPTVKQSEIKTAIAKICDVFKQFEAAAVAVKAAEGYATEKAATASRAEAKAQERDKNYSVAEEIFLRKKERLQAALDADRGEALNLIWPEKARELADQAALQAIIKNKVIEGIQKFFQPRDTADIFSNSSKVATARSITAEFSTATAQKSTAATSPIEAPEKSEEELEALGRELLEQEKGTASSAVKSSASAGVIKSAAVDGSLVMVLAALTQETPENEARWNQREEADQLAAEAAKLSTSISRQASSSLKVGGLGKASSISGNSSRASISGRSSASTASTSSSRSLLSRVSSFFQAVDPTASAVDPMEEEWISYARADASKILKCKPEEVPENILTELRKADKAALEIRNEKRHAEIEKQEMKAMQISAAEHATRWVARAEADQLRSSVEAALAKAKSTAATLATPDRAVGEYQPTSNDLKILQTQLKQAETNWSSFAQLDFSVLDAASEEKLKSSDRATLSLLESVLKQYQQGKNYIPPGAEREKANREAGAYKVDLLTKKERDLSRYFAKADAAKEKNQPAEIINQLEEKALQKYATATERDALEAARNKTSGAGEAWAYRAQQAKESTDVSESETSSQQIRTAAIAAIDQVASDAFQSESKRLTLLEKIWHEAIDNEKKETHEKRALAARSYFSGDPDACAAWYALPPEERLAYNTAIRDANEERGDVFQRAWNLAQENVKKTERKFKQIKKSYLSSSRSKKSAQEKWEDAKKELARIEAADAERKEVVRWGSLTPSQRAEERTAAEQAAAVAEVKVLAARSCEDRRQDKRDRANEIMALVKTKLWSSMSNAMKAFNEQPSEARLLSARKYASVSAAAAASAYAAANEPETTSASAYSASASAFASSSASASASAASSATAEEAAEAAETASASLKGATVVAADYRRWGSNRSWVSRAATQQNLDWSIEVAREAVTFAVEVAKYRAAEEMRSGKQKVISVGSWAKGVAEVKALEARPSGKNWKGDKDWETERDRANAILEVIKSQLWPSTSTALQAFIDHPSELRMIEARKSASAYASASASASAYAYEYTLALAHASASVYASAYATAIATAYAFSSLTTAEGAAEAAEAATAALEGSKTAAGFYKKYWLSETTTIQHLDETVERSRKLVEFAHAVAAFKARQEAEVALQAALQLASQQSK